MDVTKIILVVILGIMLLALIPILIYSIVELINEYKKESNDVKERPVENNMTNKKSSKLRLRVETLEEKLSNLEEKLSQFEKLCDARYKDVINNEENIDSIGEFLICRQYLIDTNFLGKLKNKKLIQDWKTSIIFPYDRNPKKYFKKFKEYVLNFEFVHSPNGFFEHFELLKQLEKKQELLDECKEDKS